MDKPNKNPKQEWESRIAALDAVIDSPEKRANRLYAMIKHYGPDYTDWDLVCFCVSYLTIVTPAFQFLAPSVRHLNALVYNAHYLKAHELGLLDSNSTLPDLELTEEFK